MRISRRIAHPELEAAYFRGKCTCDTSAPPTFPFCLDLITKLEPGAVCCTQTRVLHASCFPFLGCQNFHRVVIHASAGLLDLGARKILEKTSFPSNGNSNNRSRAFGDGLASSPESWSRSWGKHGLMTPSVRQTGFWHYIVSPLTVGCQGRNWPIKSSNAPPLIPCQVRFVFVREWHGLRPSFPSWPGPCPHSSAFTQLDGA